MILLTTNPENIPAWVVPVVLIGTGIYFLGRYEGWWGGKK